MVSEEEDGAVSAVVVVTGVDWLGPAQHHREDGPISSLGHI